MHTASGGGLSIMYLASNSPVGGFPGQIPSVGRDGTEAAMNESEWNPEIGVSDDRTYTGQDGSVWLWNPSILKYERGVGGGGGVAQMAQITAPPIFNMVSNFQMEEKHNFIEGANYSQIDLNGEDKNRPLNWILQFGARMCDEKDAQGFFYQQHTNGHEIIGFYVTKRDMKGKKVWHGHSRGFIAIRADVGRGEAEIVLPAIAVSVGATTIWGGGCDLPAFCVHDGLRLIGNFCAGCGAKRTDMLAGAGGGMAVVKPIDDFNGFVNTLLFRPSIILKSFNYPKHCWATTGPEEVRIESKCRDEYVPVPGLTGEPNTISFRSKCGEDTFLRHCGYWLRSHKNNGSDLFKKDATFFVRKGLVGVDEGYISFESTNFRGQYICHRSYKLRIDHSSDSDLHRKDASFKVE
ncbi:hypothetical protein TL16_g07620 [Triparma laevis f. inornata]|uniref:Alpha-L-arabinofuranosidase B arabinose-binding domain-containing protein n=1 Tax=Triparma laevis f. inornata TaxID=1714386 RepID=A0A9W7ATF4_9STRA|nr:hypothetical protein TL16_g07620 [Triparma laevis f. inornata]